MNPKPITGQRDIAFALPQFDGLPVYAPKTAPDLAPEECPHCATKFIAYHRLISGSMCTALALLTALHLKQRNPYWSEDALRFDGDSRDWWPSQAFMRDYNGERISGGPHTYFRLWNLTESKDRKGNNGVALHTLTPFGLLFVRDYGTIPRHCVEIRQQRKFFIGPMVRFRDCVGKKFDFGTMMQKAGLT